MSENKNCGIVRDLMPLVIDGAASEESKRLVEAHAGECAECAQMLADMRAATPVTAVEEDTDTRFIRFCRGLERRFRWQKAIAYLALIVVVIGALAGSAAYARYKMYDDGVPLPFREEAVEFYIDDEDRLVMCAEQASAKRPIIQYQMLTEGDVAYVCALQSAWPQWLGAKESSTAMIFDEIRLADGGFRLCEIEYVREQDEPGFNVGRFALAAETPLAALRYGTPDAYTTVWTQGEPVEFPRLP